MRRLRAEPPGSVKTPSNPPDQRSYLARKTDKPQPVSVFDLITCAPGETIIAEGVTDNHLFILQSGTVVIQKAGTPVAAVSERGTFIGEISAILGEPRSCTVIAETECDILKLTQTIDEMIATHPHITKHLLQEMAKRIKHSTNSLVQFQHTVITFQDQDVP